MNLEEKRKLLRDLKKIDFPNDQEVKLIETLEEYIAQEYNDSKPEEQKRVAEVKEEPKIERPKRTVFEYIEDKIKEKQGKQSNQRDPNRVPLLLKIASGIGKRIKEQPVTPEEIEELKKKVVKYRLKADIAKSKSIISNSKGGKMDTLNKLFGDSNQGTKKRTKSYSTRKEPDIDRDLIDYRRKTLGYNNSRRL